MLVFDVDPAPELPWRQVAAAARALRDRLADVGLASWLKTTGGKGLHVVVPLARPRPDWDTAKQFTRSVALFMERLAPAMFTSKTGENRRRQKIFVDYLRNGFGATAVAAYSPRWRPGVGIATPVAWEEIDEDIRGGHFNVHNVPDRVAKQRKDPWQGYWKARQSLTRTAIKEMETR
jgi:bifunctional non-homologous end joining protein LigD